MMCPNMQENLYKTTYLIPKSHIGVSKLTMDRISYQTNCTYYINK